VQQLSETFNPLRNPAARNSVTAENFFKALTAGGKQNKIEILVQYPIK
jgi:hypothetical protein